MAKITYIDFKGTERTIEVANGLSHYDYTFLSELSRFYADLEEQLAVDGLAPAKG